MSIEDEIQAKSLTASRVTPADVEAEIVGEHYFSAFHGVHGCSGLGAALALPKWHAMDDVTFCVLVLRNGCKVIGINYGPVDRTNFDKEHGRRDARADAIRQVWPLVGFRLRDQLAIGVLTEADAAADLAGTPRPDWSSFSSPETPA